MVRRGIVIPEYDDVISEKDEDNQDVNGQEQPQQEKETVQEEQNISPVLPDTENKLNP